MRLILLFALLCSVAVIPLVAQKQYTLKASLLDEDSKQPMAYANIINLRTLQGTASGLDGYFELPDNQIGDSLLLSFVGYEDRYLIIDSELLDRRILYLKASSNLLSEFSVLPYDDFLYDLMNRLRKNRFTNRQFAKTYFFLETDVEGEKVEMLESYFNGQYKDGHLEDLHFKKGRVGRGYSRSNRTFHSASTSRVFSMYNLFENNYLFPANPFSMSKRRFKALYKLSLTNLYEDEGKQIYVIAFEPKKGGGQYFSGKIWLDITEDKMQRIELKVEQSSRHPFDPIGDIGIRYVDIELRKTFREDKGKTYLSSMDFNYTTHYTHNGADRKAVTKAFVNAYDWENTFTLPLFDFKLDIDYRNITLAPYDKVFWDNHKEFRLYSRQEEITDFIEENELNYEESVFFKEKAFNKNWLEYPYLRWDERRFSMTEAPDSIVRRSLPDKPEEINFAFDLGMYLDYNVLADTVCYQVQAVIDPIYSFYHYSIGERDLAFINMYFDVLEIERRNLEKILEQEENLTPRRIEQLYQESLDRFEVERRSFLRQVQRGRSTIQMKIWSDYIKGKLAVDNLKLFSINS